MTCGRRRIIDPHEWISTDRDTGPATSGRGGHLHQAVVERRAVAQIGQRLRCHGIGVLAVPGELLPPDRGRADDAGPDDRPGRIDPYTGVKGAAIIEDAHSLPVNQAAPGRVVRMHVEPRFAFGLEKARKVGKAGIQEVAGRRADEGERIFRRQVDIG